MNVKNCQRQVMQKNKKKSMQQLQQQRRKAKPNSREATKKKHSKAMHEKTPESSLLSRHHTQIIHMYTVCVCVCIKNILSRKKRFTTHEIKVERSHQLTQFTGT